MKTYICIKDYQGGEWGMYRNYTAEEWGKQAYYWAESDNWENPNECLLKSFETEQGCINFIQDMWELKIVEVDINNKELIDYLNDITKYTDVNKSDWAKEILKELKKEGIKMDEIKNMFEGLEGKTKEEQLLNLFDMIREFDYARNGKETSIKFLEAVIEAFKAY